MKYILSIIAAALTLLALNSQAAVVQSINGTFTTPDGTTWISSGNINNPSGDYSCLFVFGNECSPVTVGLLSYDASFASAQAYCPNCRLPTANELISLSGEDLSFLTLTPDSVYWALDESGNPFLFGNPAVDLDFGSSSRAVGLFGTMVVSAVPVPAAIWLFLSGLVGLGFIGRKI